MAEHRYLIAGPAWIGDMVMAQSLFIYLNRIHPGAEIDVVAPQWSVPLLERMPEVRCAIALATNHGELGLVERYRKGRDLRSKSYHQAIILPRSFKSALLPWFANIKRRTGFRGEMRYGLLNDIRPLDRELMPQVAQRYVALGLEPNAAFSPEEIPRPTLRVDSAVSEQLLERFQLNLNDPVVALLPGAEYGPAKRWPSSHFAKLAQGLADDGYQIWQLGSERDRGVALEIDQLTGGRTHILCGETELVEAIDLLALCSAAVTNDSGLMHIAAAVGTPLVAIYGSSSPDYTPPLTDRAAICYRALECSPCFKRDCPLGHTNCLNGIDSATVREHLDSLVTIREGVE